MPPRLLLIQLLPILVFIAVDAMVQDPVWAISSALGFVALQTAVTFARTRRLDPLILLDALLIGGLGAISLISRDELFFKLKPAIIEALLVPLLLLLGLGSERLLCGYLGRYSLGAVEPERLINAQTLPLMRRMLLAMAGLVALHAGLVVLAALSWSRQAWAWTSGPGFYVLLLPLFGYLLLRRLAMRRAPVAEAGPEQRPGTRVSGRRR